MGPSTLRAAEAARGCRIAGSSPVGVPLCTCPEEAGHLFVGEDVEGAPRHRRGAPAPDLLPPFRPAPPRARALGAPIQARPGWASGGSVAVAVPLACLPCMLVVLTLLVLLLVALAADHPLDLAAGG